MKAIGLPCCNKEVTRMGFTGIYLDCDGENTAGDAVGLREECCQLLESGVIPVENLVFL